MTELARLQERLTQLRQAPNSAVSYKDFSAPSEHDYEVLRSLYAVKRDATTLGSRDSEQAFFSAYVETVSTLRETVLPATCKAYKINNGDICGAGLHGDTNENIRHCGKHSARSAWVTFVETPPSTWPRWSSTAACCPTGTTRAPPCSSSPSPIRAARPSFGRCSGQPGGG